MILASKLGLDSSTCSENGKTRWCLHLSQGALKNLSVCSPGGLIACFFYNQIGILLVDRMGEIFCSNKLSGGLTNTHNTLKIFRSNKNQPSK